MIITKENNELLKFRKFRKIRENLKGTSYNLRFF